MTGIKTTLYKSVDSLVTEVLDKLEEQEVDIDFGIVGTLDTVQDVLKGILQKTDCAFDTMDIDVNSYDDIYQLIIDAVGLVSILPVSNDIDNGIEITYGSDYVYVSDEMRMSYIGKLDASAVKYTVFGFDDSLDSGDNKNNNKSESKSTAGTATKATGNKTDKITHRMTDEEAEDFMNRMGLEVVYNQYHRLPDKYQQMVDLIMDWGL